MKNFSQTTSQKTLEKRPCLGILGGGQLGRMLISEAIDLDIHTSVLDPSADAPCAPICHEFVQGSFHDFDTVLAFGRGKDVVTIEIENVNTDALDVLEKEGITVLPSPAVLRMVKDKGLQKAFYHEHGIPTSRFVTVDNKSAIMESGFAFPMAQKLRTGGYDGKGVQILRSEADLGKAFDAPSVLEEAVDIDKELSVIVARNASGEVRIFPVVELVFDPEANLVDVLMAPARISDQVAQKATDIALMVVEKSSFIGLLAVELFLTKAGEILVNEIAPRPHNSGHHTIEANLTSQYGQHLRAIFNWPLGSVETLRPAAMVNLLGAPENDGPVCFAGMNEALKHPGAYVHLYGKSHTKPFRKMGHITVLSDTAENALSKALKLKAEVAVLARQ